jgi:secreted PhoX family phosphatase
MNDERPVFHRRGFALALTSTAFAGLVLSRCAGAVPGAASGVTGATYGPLEPDPGGILDLPRGFSYRIISALGEAMDDGHRVPNHADGMGAIPIDGRRVALVRNHELLPDRQDVGPFKKAPPATFRAFDRAANGMPLPGGTTTIVYDCVSGRVESQYLSLSGTIRNCAGGTTPWGSWLSCEEYVDSADEGLHRQHGWVFEVPASARGVVEPVPLKAMGRFNHEAAATDPRTGIVYLTEDREDGLFYRFLPHARGRLARGGRLQALGWRDTARRADSRNWSGRDLAAHEWVEVRWLELDNVEAPADDLRQRGHAAGAVVFARGEGIHFGDGEMYFCCTNGGAAKVSQIMRYRPSALEGQPGEAAEPGRLQLFFESNGKETLSFGDNIVLAPNGHLIVCEDEDSDVVHNRLRGVTPSGEAYDLARLRLQTETAGVCFSPDGRTMFVNVYSPTKTLAVTGPWRSFGAGSRH